MPAVEQLPVSFTRRHSAVRSCLAPDRASAPGVYRNGADAFSGKALQQFRSHLHRVCAVRADALLVSIVQQNVRAYMSPLRAETAALHTGQNPLRADRLPVEPHHVPLYEL